MATAARKFDDLPEWANTLAGQFILSVLADAPMSSRHVDGVAGPVIRYMGLTDDSVRPGTQPNTHLIRLRAMGDAYFEAVSDADPIAARAYLASGEGYSTPADALVAQVRGERLFETYEAAVRSAFGMGAAA